MRLSAVALKAVATRLRLNAVAALATASLATLVGSPSFACPGGHVADNGEKPRAVAAAKSKKSLPAAPTSPSTSSAIPSATQSSTAADSGSAPAPRRSSSAKQ